MSTLKEQVAERKREEAKAPSCFQFGSNVHYVEFRPDAHTRVGFPTHPCHYRLEPNPGDEAAPEKLTLAFHTADVVITGARLDRLIEHISRASVASVNALDAHFAGALGNTPWVAKITIKFLGKAHA